MDVIEYTHSLYSRMQRREARLGILDGCCARNAKEGFEGFEVVVGGGEEDGLRGVVH
jgi:hypothetical protein